jgi:predicted permease
MKQMLTESALLGFAGSIGGVVLAVVLRRPLVHSLPPIRDFTTTRLPLSLDLRLDHRVLGFSLAIFALTTILFGLAPAISFSSTTFADVLRAGRIGTTWRGRRVLVGLQIALCTTLLSGAALLVRTFNELRKTDPGFDRNHVVTFSTDPSLVGYTSEQEAELMKRLSVLTTRLPGVLSVAFAEKAVMRGRGLGRMIAPMGRNLPASELLNTSVNIVSPHYFEAMGIRVLEGSDFVTSDGSDVKPVRVAVNQTFARRFFPNTDPIGRQFGDATYTTAASADFVITEVVSDAKYRSLREPTPPTYFSSFNNYTGPFILHVRTIGTPKSLIVPIQRILASIDPRLAFVEIHTLEEEVDSSTAGERLTAILASSFGLLAAFLTAVGVYGLLAYAVTQRRREIAIRMAVGATHLSVFLLIGRQVLVLLLGGVILGLTVALLATPVIRSILYNVKPFDPLSLGAASILVAFAVAIGSGVPAIRAMRIEPNTALRED